MIDPKLEERLRSITYRCDCRPGVDWCSTCDTVHDAIHELNKPHAETSRLYFESHVTIEPVFDERLERAGQIARIHHFQVADLLMQKRKQDTPERSKHDTFMTGRNKRYTVLDQNMRALIVQLEAEGFKVWRAKIEDTLFDTKHGDVL